MVAVGGPYARKGAKSVVETFLLQSLERWRRYMCSVRTRMLGPSTSHWTRWIASARKKNQCSGRRGNTLRLANKVVDADAEADVAIVETNFLFVSFALIALTLVGTRFR